MEILDSNICCSDSSILTSFCTQCLRNFTTMRLLVKMHSFFGRKMMILQSRLVHLMKSDKSFYSNLFSILGGEGRGLEILYTISYLVTRSRKRGRMWLVLISGDLDNCQPILVRESSWGFIGLTLEQIKTQDFSDFSVVIYFLKEFYWLLMVLWYYTNLLSGMVHPNPGTQSSLTSQQTFTFALFLYNE